MKNQNENEIDTDAAADGAAASAAAPGFTTVFTVVSRDAAAEAAAPSAAASVSISFSFFISHFHFSFQFCFSHLFLPQMVLMSSVQRSGHWVSEHLETSGCPNAWRLSGIFRKFFKHLGVRVPDVPSCSPEVRTSTCLMVQMPPRCDIRT